MSTLPIPILCVCVMFAVAAYSIVKDHQGRPVLWAIAMFIAWPVLGVVTGAKFRSKPMLVSTLIADLVLAVCLVVGLILLQGAGLERRSAQNLHELGQALIDYADQHGDALPSAIEDLRPYLQRQPEGNSLPPAFISPYADNQTVIGYRLRASVAGSKASQPGTVRLDDVPADARIIEDAYAPSTVRIGVYADGSVRSY